MASLWYQALLVAEGQCVQKGHQDGSREIYIVWTEQTHSPGVCQECLEYARTLKEDAEREEALTDKKTMTLKLDKRSKLTLIDGEKETQITFMEAAHMFGSDCLMILTQAIGPAKCDTATIDVRPILRERRE